MKCFIIDFKSISFTKFKVHGGGDFALRAVDFLISLDKTFYIINNSTEFFKEYSVSDIKDISVNLSDYEIYYFNPLYQGGDNNDFQYTTKYIYIHGLRMLEMPYDSTSHKYFKFPENIKTFIKGFALKNYYNKSGKNLLEEVDKLKGSKVILTPSEHSKYMMESSYNLKSKILVLPPFLSLKYLDSNKDLPTKKNYILMLNGDRWVKNSYRFLQAFSALKSQGKLTDIDLVMVGIPIFKNKFESKDIHFIDYVEREYLEKLMKNCYFLAYPSLNEGFGYPPLDCFKYSKPVLSTSLSSPNILYNGQVVFTNPYSVDEIKSRMLYLVDNYETYRNGKIYYNEVTNLINSKWQKIFY